MTKRSPWRLMAAALLGLGYLLVGADKGQALMGWAAKPAPVMIIWFVFWPLWETIFPSKPKEGKAPRERMKDLLGR